MIKISQIKLPVGHSRKELDTKLRRMLKLSAKEVFSYEIRKRSLDARKKPELFYVYTVYVSIKNEQALIKKIHSPQVTPVKDKIYRFPEPGQEALKKRPVIAGAGPAGLFAAYQLAKSGYAPLVLERGSTIEKRTKDVEDFWERGILLPQSNVQFGEGGAGTFSDGKLNTVVKDPTGRNRFVLETFVHYGAPQEILFDAKPHIGTDILAKVISDMRRDIENMGAEFKFDTTLTDLVFEGGRLSAVIADGEKILTDTLILAPGHSARDTFLMLQSHLVPMECKNFAVGFRVEHPQEMIDEAMYGRKERGELPASPYKVTSNFPNGRGVYSFCMCPGGYVVNASSEAGHTCVNGMSYSGRSGKNANSAIIISVTPEDFKAYSDVEDPLLGMRFQEHLERENYRLCDGKIPQQLYGDYCHNKKSSSYGGFSSETKGLCGFSDLRGLMSYEMENSFMSGMEHFAKIVPGFDREDAILSGMETRTSSPVRILRDEKCESAFKGLYPCGEGAGYAGGIMSAAMDGLKAASALMERYTPDYST